MSESRRQFLRLGLGSSLLGAAGLPFPGRAEARCRSRTVCCPPPLILPCVEAAVPGADTPPQPQYLLAGEVIPGYPHTYPTEIHAPSGDFVVWAKDGSETITAYQIGYYNALQPDNLDLKYTGSSLNLGGSFSGRFWTFDNVGASTYVFRIRWGAGPTQFYDMPNITVARV
jgi:hypothetical protein